MNTPHPLVSPTPAPSRAPVLDWHHWILGGTIFYLASAACILIGVYQIIVPLYNKPDIALEKFGCLATLNAYELLVIGVTLLIVLWGQVTDDAVLLAFLVAAFLIGSAIALDTVAPDFPGPTLAFGAAGLLLAIGKIYALGRWITGRVNRLALLGVGLLLAWNFLMPGLVGLIMGRGLIVAPLRHIWLIGGLVTLFGGAVLVEAAARIPSGTGGRDDNYQPFLATSVMRWSLILLGIVGVFVHQYALNWAFGLNFRAADMLPALAVFSLLLVELRRAYTPTRQVRDLLPLVITWFAVIVCTMGDTQTVRPGWNLGAISFAPIVALGMAGVVEIMAWRHRWLSLHAMALAYLGAGCWFSVIHATRTISGGWMLVMLAFPILILGATVSLLKPQPRRVGVAS